MNSAKICGLVDAAENDWPLHIDWYQMVLNPLSHDSHVLQKQVLTWAIS